MEPAKNKTDRGQDLWWMNPATGKRFHAGKAYYNERLGEYRIKIDEFPKDKLFYLKPIGIENEEVHYRVEQAIVKNGKVCFRKEKGDGYSSDATGGDVHIDFASCMKILVLCFKNKSKQKEST